MVFELTPELRHFVLELFNRPDKKGGAFMAKFVAVNFMTTESGKDKDILTQSLGFDIQDSPFKLVGTSRKSGSRALHDAIGKLYL